MHLINCIESHLSLIVSVRILLMELRLSEWDLMAVVTSVQNQGRWVLYKETARVKQRKYTFNFSLDFSWIPSVFLFSFIPIVNGCLVTKRLFNICGLYFAFIVRLEMLRGIFNFYYYYYFYFYFLFILFYFYFLVFVFENCNQIDEFGPM